MFCMLLFNFVNDVFLLLCTFLSGCSVSLCCSVYCLCVNVYCTTATGCQPNCSWQIYHIISYHISYHIISHYITSYHIPYHIPYISYHISSYHVIYHIIPYHIPYHIIYHIIISRHITSHNIIPYHIPYLSYLIISRDIVSYHKETKYSYSGHTTFFIHIKTATCFGCFPRTPKAVCRL